MPQIFHPSMNTFARVSIFGAIFMLAGLVLLLWFIVRTPYVTEAGVVREQPVPFSHRHHVGDAGLDCRYCHTSVEDSSFAGIPATSICMNCHSYLFADSPMLAPVRESFRLNVPLAWTRVHNLPDFVYFDHSIHIAKGVACVSCHGRVDDMPLMWREHTLHMQWCLDCHRQPEKFVVPPDRVFDPQALEPNREGLGLLNERGVTPASSFEAAHGLEGLATGGGASEVSPEVRNGLAGTLLRPGEALPSPAAADGDAPRPPWLDAPAPHGVAVQSKITCYYCHR